MIPRGRRRTAGAATRICFTATGSTRSTRPPRSTWMPLAVKSLILLAVALASLWGWTQYRAGVHEARAEAAYPPKGRFVTVDGTRVHGVVMGQSAGDAPDLVLIHGASGNT